MKGAGRKNAMVLNPKTKGSGKKERPAEKKRFIFWKYL
jgi:hypothetical protein